jgi:hypothetical protein
MGTKYIMLGTCMQIASMRYQSLHIFKSPVYNTRPNVKSLKEEAENPHENRIQRLSEQMSEDAIIVLPKGKRQP